MTPSEKLVSDVARAIKAADLDCQDAPNWQHLAKAAIAIVVERCAEVALADGMLLALKKRKTRNLGLPRDAYPTEIAREIHDAILALSDRSGGGRP